MSTKKIILVHLDGTEGEMDTDAWHCDGLVIAERVTQATSSADFGRTFPADMLKDKYNPKWAHLFPKPPYRSRNYRRNGWRDGRPIFWEYS